MAATAAQPFKLLDSNMTRVLLGLSVGHRFVIKGAKHTSLLPLEAKGGKPKIGSHFKVLGHTALSLVSKAWPLKWGLKCKFVPQVSFTSLKRNLVVEIL